jgi:hypothetical protein
MRKVNWGGICLLLIVLTALPAQADNVQFGTQNVSLGIGLIKPGDDLVERIDDSIFAQVIGVRVPVNENIDFVSSVLREKLDGSLSGVDVDSTVFSIDAGIEYHLSAGEGIVPAFKISLAYLDADTNIARYSTSDDDIGFEVGLGVEFKMTDTSSLLPSITYAEGFGEDDISIGVSMANWFTPKIGLKGEIGYTLDAEDFVLGLIVLVGF